jgi:hypothetical protein
VARAITLAISLLALACTSTYQVWFRDRSDDWPAIQPEVEHCLSSLDFRDASADEWYANYLVENPEIVAVWKPAPERSFFDTSPYAVAWVVNTHEGLHVHFQPGNMQGPYAKSLAASFRSCIHSQRPESDLEITTDAIFPDLR